MRSALRASALRATDAELGAVAVRHLGEPKAVQVFRCINNLHTPLSEFVAEGIHVGNPKTKLQVPDGLVAEARWRAKVV